MKKDDVKVGLWIQSAASTAPLRVVWFDDKGLLCASRDDQSRYWLYAEQLPHIGLFDPAELTAAGVPDSLRLVEQRSEWEGVTFKSLTDKYHPQNLVSVHIDNSHAFYARATNDFLEIGTPRLYSYQFDVTGQCDPLRARPDVLQAVVKFRSERREAGLKWNLGDGWIYRVKAGRAEGWMNESKMWRPIAGPPDSSARVIMNCSDATPEQIAQSGCPIADVPESMKIEVERLRGAKTLKCGLTVRVGDLVSTEPTAVMRDYIFRVFSLDTGNDEHAAKIERWDEGKKGWHRSAYVIYMDRVWQHSSPEKIAATTIPTTDIPDPALREAVEKIRAGKATEEIWECECCGAHHALFKPANCMHCTCPRLKNIGKHNCKLSPSPAATRTAFDAETWPVNAWIELKITASTYSRSEFIRAAREANDKFGEEAVESMYFPDDEDSENAMFTFKVASVSRLTQTLAFISIQEQVYDVGIYGSGSVPGHEVRFSFSSETEPSASLRINPEVSDNARVKSIEKAMTILRDALNLSANMEAK